MHAGKQISVWFFIGLLLLVYGALILGTGIVELTSPPERTVVLQGLHMNVWWGALVLVLGIVYVWLFNPGER